jgi:hypothetical protein
MHTNWMLAYIHKMHALSMTGVSNVIVKGLSSSPSHVTYVYTLEQPPYGTPYAAVYAHGALYAHPSMSHVS